MSGLPGLSQFQLCQTSKHVSSVVGLIYGKHLLQNRQFAGSQKKWKSFFLASQVFKIPCGIYSFIGSKLIAAYFNLPKNHMYLTELADFMKIFLSDSSLSCFQASSDLLSCHQEGKFPNRARTMLAEDCDSTQHY